MNFSKRDFKPVIFCFGIPLLCLSLFSGCSVKDPTHPAFIVAKGKGVKITRADLDQARGDYVKQMGMDVAQIPKEILANVDKEVLEQKVMQLLLLEMGKELKIPDMETKIEDQIKKIKASFKTPEEFAAKMKEFGVTEEKIRKDMKDNITIQEVFLKNVPLGKDADPAEVLKFYNEHPQAFDQPRMVKASHVLVKFEPTATAQEKKDKKAKIDKARARIAKGEGFGVVAKEVSDDPGSAAQEGNLGFFPEGKMVPEFDKVAFSTKVNTLSPVFETAYGYHFLKVFEAKPAGKVSIEEATPRIAEHLKRLKQQSGVESFLAKLKTDAAVEYFLPEPPKMPNPSMPEMGGAMPPPQGSPAPSAGTPPPPSAQIPSEGKAKAPASPASKKTH